MSRPALSVVIPCYNEEKVLLELRNRVSQAAFSSVGEDYEIVLINDGSKDRTWPMMKDMSKADNRLICINLSRNYGHQLALSAGLKFCRGQRILVLDADLQDPPELLGQMMARMDDGCDVVYGVRIERAGETAFKRTSAFLFYRTLDKLVDIKIPPDTGDFRLMTRRAVDILNNMPEQHRFIRGMVSWIGLRQESISYERQARFAGESNYPISKMLRLAADAITSFSVRPLRIASYLGVICSIASGILLLYVVVQHFLGHTAEGWTSLAFIVLALGSGQMLMMGIIGEYLGRLYIEAKGRPLYIVDEIVSAAPLPRTQSQVTESIEVFEW